MKNKSNESQTALFKPAKQSHSQDQVESELSRWGKIENKKRTKMNRNLLTYG